MSEYISKEKAIARFEEIKKSGVSLRDTLYLDGVITVLENIQTEDVSTIVHGKWIFNDDWWEFRCTNCNGAIGNIKKYEYCPYCGARMDLEE